MNIKEASLAISVDRKIYDGVDLSNYPSQFYAPKKKLKLKTFFFNLIHKTIFVREKDSVKITKGKKESNS